mmetsp:Transcript_114885/g.321055  ORF Transcript_114885/g.321055 Transcript_114885/m.321055 type:complete len:490 (+) Transcript_114885:96-1565(+)
MGCWTSSMFGPAADDLLAYQTLKVVRIKDHRLGLIYYALIFLIVLFIFGYELLYCNDHFDKRDVSGTSRIALRHPTKEHCDPALPTCESNFSSLLNLSYCSVYAGAQNAGKQLDCEFADRLTLLPNGVMGNEMLVPTRIIATDETADCTPGPGNNYTCSNVFQHGESRERYVADIERFSILIAHSYRRDTLSGNNNRVLGYYMMCDISGMSDQELRVHKLVYGDSECAGIMRRKPIECVDDSCHFPQPGAGESSTLVAGLGVGDDAFAFGNDRPGVLQGRRAGRVGSGRSGARLGVGGGSVPSGGSALSARSAPQDFDDDGVFAIPEGDIFSIEKLLQLAGVTSLDNATNNDGEPLRSSGTVVNVEVRYSNLVPFASTFGRGEVTYEYHVSLKPLHQVKDDYVSSWGLALGGRRRTRTTERRNGILFVVNVGGEFGFFSILNLMMMLAEAASMLAVATILTDKIAIYFMERAERYYESKYEEPTMVDDP